MSKNTKPQGTKPASSKYALKCAARRKAALALGLPSNTPWPVIWAASKPAPRFQSSWRRGEVDGFQPSADWTF